jgi:hypothetical protein
MPLVCAIKTTFFAGVRPLCEITSVLELCKFLVIQTFKNVLLVSLDYLSLASLATDINKSQTAGEKTERKTCKKKLQKKSIQSDCGLVVKYIGPYSLK